MLIQSNKMVKKINTLKVITVLPNLAQLTTIIFLGGCFNTFTATAFFLACQKLPA